MNRNFKILISIGLFILIIFSGVYWFYNTYSNLTIDFNPISGSKVYLYASDNPKNITKVVAGKSIKLKNKEYILKVNGDNIREKTMAIPLNQDTKIFIPVVYKESYLNNMLPNNIESLNNLINTKYGQQMFKYKIEKIKLSKDENWAVGKLVKKNGDINSDSYKFIAHKDSVNWEIAASPALAISSYEYPKIPKEVLQDTINL